jgi:hypothetical protein
VVEVFGRENTTPLYRRTVFLKENFSYRALWQPSFGILVGDMSVFPYGDIEKKGIEPSDYPLGQNNEEVVNGRLRPFVNYTLKLTVISPTSLTNNLGVWLYYFREGEWRRE